MATTSRSKKFAAALAVIALAATFFALGIWQLGRAREQSAENNSTQEVQDQRIYPLTEIASPDGQLQVVSFAKNVSAQGHYIATFKAPNQIAADGSVADWEIALMQVDTDTAILVLRGLWSQRLSSPEIVMSSLVDVTGRIYPHQVEDRAANTSAQLSRLDAALITSATDLQLYDGFIAASSESHRGTEIVRDRIAIAAPETGGVPGYYWQHISYVVIWWLMAVLVLWAPFYKRREEQ